ncbi:hypothetical protein SRHO_G00098620 [Serrasalmus rhombeus]
MNLLQRENKALKDDLIRLKDELVQKDTQIISLTEQLLQETARHCTDALYTKDFTLHPENSGRPVQPPKTALLIDSNGKFLKHRQMFPTHRVGKFWCPTTQAAHELLHPAQLGAPDNIIIHTGTNELRSHGKSLTTAVIQTALKAQQEFPNTNITISTLLPQRDILYEMIKEVNDIITTECAKMTGIKIAHPTLTAEHLYDHVHVDKNNAWMLAYDLGAAMLTLGSQHLIQSEDNQSTSSTRM